MKKILGVFLLATGIGTAMAAAPPDFHPVRIPTPVLAGEIALPVDNAATSTVVERWGRANGGRFARNVTRPTLTPVLPPPGKANGAAVIVAPGGAFSLLSMDGEGFNVARRLADQGITAFVLKYRLNPGPDDEGEFFAALDRAMSAPVPADQPPPIKDPYAVQDALAALKRVRDEAARWHVDASRVGMIGFSAGAMTTLQAVLAPAGGPAFFGYIYGPMAPVEVPAQAPPMFAALAMDDPLFGGRGFAIIERWHAAHRPVELHVYERGGHGFGTGVPGTTTTLVMQEFITWLRDRGLLSPAAAR